jgi:excisionase family DNA binding protein
MNPLGAAEPPKIQPVLPTEQVTEHVHEGAITALPPILSVEEAAELLKVGHVAVRRMLLRGLLPGTKIGRRWLIRTDLLLQRLSEGGAR